MSFQRLVILPATGESIKLAINAFDHLPDLERRIIYSAFSIFMGTLETTLSTPLETQQVVLSRDGKLPTKEHIKKATSASFVPASIKKSFPVASIIIANEITKEIQKENNGKPISDSAKTIIGIFCGAIAGILSLPANTASDISIKTGKKVELKDILKKGLFIGWQGRAFQKGIHVGSVLISRLIIEKLNHSKDNSPNPSIQLKTPSKPSEKKHSISLAQEKQYNMSNPFL